jgi:hypothetical protein
MPNLSYSRDSQTGIIYLIINYETDHLKLTPSFAKNYLKEEFLS